MRTIALAAVVLLTACASPEARHQRDAWRTMVKEATPDHLAGLLRERFAVEGACLDQLYPATVHDDTATTADDSYDRPYELLRSVGLVTREEVHPGDADWALPASASVDSGGTKRITRYTLTPRAEPYTEPLAPDDARLRLCWAKRRLLGVDSVVTRGPTMSISAGRGVTWTPPTAYVRYAVTFEQVAPWVLEVVPRDTLSEFGQLRAPMMDGTQHRWATFTPYDGAWIYSGSSTAGPR